jgi:hypothetical protein
VVGYAAAEIRALNDSFGLEGQSRRKRDIHRALPGRRLHGVMRGLLLCCLAMALVALAGFSQVVSWDEDVVLNSGDAMTVHRDLPYARGGAPGNPLDIGWNPQRGGKISFAWKGGSTCSRNTAARC